MIGAAAVAAQHDADALALALQLLRQPDREWSLAGAADSDVADHDDGPRDADARQQPNAIRGTPGSDDQPEQPGQRQQQQREPGRVPVVPHSLQEPIARGTHAANCIRWSDAYWPLPASSSACVPLSTMRPASITTMRSAFSTVDSRCAMTSVVRLCISFSSAAWMMRSDSVSSADVASSRIRTGAFFSSARAMEMRWR